MRAGQVSAANPAEQKSMLLVSSLPMCVVIWLCDQIEKYCVCCKYKKTEWWAGWHHDEAVAEDRVDRADGLSREARSHPVHHTRITKRISPEITSIVENCVVMCAVVLVNCVVMCVVDVK